MIQVENLTKSFEQEKAVEDLNISVNKGSIYGLLGSNGAGKTTLLKILAGIYRPDQGSVYIQGEPIYENVSLKQDVVFIPDALYFLPQANIQQMAEFYKSFYPNWDQERYEKLKQVFNINPKRKVHRLSKGMQRQVAFWLALSAMPSVLILDEPIDGLDPVMRQKIKNLLFQDIAERELTVIISSHNLRELEDICDHVGIMHKGTLQIEKELDELKTDTHKIQVAFEEDEEVKDQLTEELNILHEEKRGSVHLFIIRGNKWDIEKKIRPFQPLVFDMLPLTLEEIFIYEMGGIGYEIENVLI
ncbi:ABC transporter ATP-binding protein [Salibacterium salarium]|uniref:ABC transporter ATP-binding protein n=1 Tax=Salibacterium salarium TaxID=284579 RepID=A0A3R9P4G1_9BACI|nr:ABC transporter ATP-binding protein [Salibacterium salarium]RSL30131.1 ABC transporter ATP-binding protein [Salibacterium salarium]